MKPKGAVPIELSNRQNAIMQLVKRQEPITGEQIADTLGISKPTIRSDLTILVMLGYLDAKPKVGYFLGKVAATDRQAFQQLSGWKVKDIQAVPVIVRTTATVHDAVVTLFLENVGSLIVADENSLLLGVISRKDLLKVTLGNSASATMPVSLVMTRQPNIITVDPDDSVLEAGRKMVVHQVDSLPVVQQVALEGSAVGLEVVGRITKTHMTKVLLDFAAGGGY